MISPRAAGPLSEFGIAPQNVHELLQRRFVIAGQHVAGRQLLARGAVFRLWRGLALSSAARSGAPWA